MKSTTTINRIAVTSTGTVGAKVSKAEESSAGEETVEWIDQKANAQALRAAQARQVSGRRRFVDPTTCERDYSVAEMEFMQAMQDYKARSGRMFPTWSEVLEVLQALGYEKQAPSGAIPEVPGASAPKRVTATSSETRTRQVANAG
jgi:hypothetical protein